MQITHQEARHLIQLRADNHLIASDKEMLNAHLKECVECIDYANEIQETEAILRTTVRKHWNQHHVPLLTKVIKEKLFPTRRLFDLVPTRSALIGVTFLFFVFAFLQFNATHTESQSSVAIGISAAPTPSLLFTGTQNHFGNCQIINYPVNQDDTLESLARKFMVSTDVITELNHLQPDVVRLPVTLLMPACELTPTGTSHPPTFTNTPSLEPITYTPG
jgi:LysM domain